MCVSKAASKQGGTGHISTLFLREQGGAAVPGQIPELDSVSSMVFIGTH